MLPTPGAEVGACGPQSPGPPRDGSSRPSGLRVRCCEVGPSFPSRSLAIPCSVLHELPQRLATGLWLRAPWLPVLVVSLELTVLLKRSRGIGLPPRLPKGLGSGLAALVVGAVLLGFSSALSLLLSPPTSLNPEINRRLRGRNEDDDAGVELVRTSLACIAGDLDYTVKAGGRKSAALIALVLMCWAESGLDGDVYSVRM